MRPAAPLIAACVGLALASTLAPWALAFDPEAWLVWGRESGRLELATTGGPSWKPLPVGVTALLSLLGSAAPWAWLVVARSAGLLAVAGAAALALRVTGSRSAAAVAGILVAISPWWAHNTALGNSEGMLVAAILWGIWAHLEGRRGLALGLGLAAALLRPETWPFLGLYVVWLWREDPPLRRAGATALVAVPLAWCGPELLSSGEPFRAADAALGTPSAGSAALDDAPALSVFGDAIDLMTWPVALAAGLLLAALAVRRRLSGPVLALGAGTVAWVALVAVMTAAGFAGNPRYSAPAAALAVVLAACACGTVGRRWALALGIALVAVVAALQAGPLDDQRADVARRADLREQLHVLIDRGGGPSALRACGPVRAYRATTTTVAWHLDVALEDLPKAAPPDAVAVRARGREGGPLTPALDEAGLAALPRATGTADWELRTACSSIPRR